MTPLFPAVAVQHTLMIWKTPSDEFTDIINAIKAALRMEDRSDAPMVVSKPFTFFLSSLYKIQYFLFFPVLFLLILLCPSKESTYELVGSQGALWSDSSIIRVGEALMVILRAEDIKHLSSVKTRLVTRLRSNIHFYYHSYVFIHLVDKFL